MGCGCDSRLCHGALLRTHTSPHGFQGMTHNVRIIRHRVGEISM